MISRRLTKIQKNEILEAYRAGENTNTLAEKFSCSSNTINRTVKTLLSDIEYKSLKKERSKSINKKVEHVKGLTTDASQEDFEEPTNFETLSKKVQEDEQSISTEAFYSYEFNEIPLIPIEALSPPHNGSNENSHLETATDLQDNNFEEIVPLISDFDFEKKELDFQILNQEALPESVYMIVDKKVELEIRLISDLPEWSFLPENELKRNAILLFSNQRTAKRNCSRNQRVIKIPNTNVFEFSKSHLVSKGVTRLILEDSIITLEN